MKTEVMWALKLNDTGAFKFVSDSKVSVKVAMILNEISYEKGEIVMVKIREVKNFNY